MPDRLALNRRTIGSLVIGMAALIAALAPWWRNRHFLRDFLDYGLMMTASGRIHQGERPFVDFITPLQTATYWINAAAETAFGGTFQAMTLGNGVFIAGCLGLLTWLLNRRLPGPASVALAATVVIGSATQHTIIWYNAVGVVCLAAVSWSTAVAPVWRRETRIWHWVVVGGLIIGGMNKLNFQVLTLTMAIGWTLRAGLIGKAPWARVGATLGVWLASGLIFPVLLELLLTGATWSQWYHNVIDLPFSARGGNFAKMLTADFYLHPMHDYYGPVLGPAGAVAVGWVLLTAWLAWRGRGGLDRLILSGASLLAIGGVCGLMATNHEIIYVSLAAGIALVVSLWLGYELMDRRGLRNVALITPTVVLGGAMWLAAWQGQRSQFGHSGAPRDTYRELGGSSEVFAYMRGTRIPPDMAGDLERLVAEIPAPEPNGLYSCFYGPGVEWLERVWPNHHLPNLPLILDDLTLGEEQFTRLRNAFNYPPAFKLVVGMQSWKDWPANLNGWIARSAVIDHQGGLIVSRFDGDWLRNGLKPHNDAIAVLSNFGGNSDPNEIKVEEPLWPFMARNAESFIGTYRGRGSFLFDRASFRMNGEALITRIPQTEDRAASATFKVLDATIEENNGGSVLWEETTTLPPGEPEIRVNYHLDTRGRPTRFVVEVPDESQGLIRAGWKLPNITHSDFRPTDPPPMRHPTLVALEITDDVRRALLPEPWRNDVDIIARGGSFENGKVIIARGGELWIRPRRPIARLHGFAGLVEGGIAAARVIWYRGGRIQVLQQEWITSVGNPMGINAWPAEIDGWYGVLIDPSSNPSGVSVVIDEITPQ